MSKKVYKSGDWAKNKEGVAGEDGWFDVWHEVEGSEDYTTSLPIASCAHYEDKGDRASFIRDAFNVREETGLTPRELLEQRDELIEALQYLMDWQVKHVKVWNNSAYDMAHAVVAKITKEQK